ncbi:MAG: DUF4062 domain-containing protein, partial [Bacteroidales bacterium]|nr:DUF4062 domain-containing protein [Bacteroidales bacterium]
MKSNKWKTIRVFISSTFKDFHVERDHLIRFVFPELKEKCRKYRVNLIDMDLRWGVTEQDAQAGKALDICLDEIDSCRPYFLGLLGHRYGWIPDGENHSITAQEIYHGVLENEVPRQIVDLRRIIDGKLEGKELSDEQKNILVKSYPFDAEKRKYLLSDQTTNDELNIIKSIVKIFSIYQRERSFFFFRSEDLTNKLAGNKIEDFFEKEKKDQDILTNLIQKIKDEKLWWTAYDYIEAKDENDITAFGRKVKDVLWEHIEAEIKTSETEEEKDWLEEEAEYHELFIADRTRRFVGRKDILENMHEFCKSDDQNNLMVITGESGCGKSALMGRFTEEVMHQHSDRLIIPHFVGASPSSTNLRHLLLRFSTVLSKEINSTEEIPEDINKLKSFFTEILQKTANEREILLIIDAVNQLEKGDDAHNMDWLPFRTPKNVKFIISTLNGEAKDALLRREKLSVQEVKGLNESDIKIFVNDYLEEIKHEFPNKNIEDQFFDKIKHGHPLYIQVALEELRVFGDFDKLGDRICKLPDTVPDLFIQVLERIEKDFSKPLVKECLSLIACGKQGMTAEELQDLLKGFAPKTDTNKELKKYPDMLWKRLLRSFCTYLFERSGVIDYFHNQFKEAVGARYLSKKEDRLTHHQKIADYFDSRWQEPYVRALNELPHQLLKIELWDNVTDLLCDLNFIQAKSAAKLTYDLVKDYDDVLTVIPDNKENIRQKKEGMEKYIRDLIAYAKGEIKKLDIPQSQPPWSKEKINEEIKRIKTNPNRLDRLNAFINFLWNEANNLQDYAMDFPYFASQQAWNYTNTGPVGEAAETGSPEIRQSLLLCSQPTRPPWNPMPQALQTLKGHTERVEPVSITADGKRAISGSDDKTCILWNLQTGEKLQTLKGHTRGVESVSITPDGKRAISGSYDKTCILWDLQTGEKLQTLKGHTERVRSVSITPDGKRAISGSLDNTCILWDLQTGEALQTLKGHTRSVESVSIIPDGKRAISGSGDKTCILWDLQTGEKLKTLKGHNSWVTAVSITPDGKRAISGSTDKSCILWDLQTGEKLQTLKGHTNDVVSVSITPDGKRAISGAKDNTCILWDLQTGEKLQTLKGHTGLVQSVSITPDGKRAISGS